MNVAQIKKMAQNKGIKPGKMRKADLIRAIQTEEGNFPCFASATEQCDQLDCCWREDCLS